jgi:hypothetical protein
MPSGVIASQPQGTLPMVSVGNVFSQACIEVAISALVQNNNNII